MGAVLEIQSGADAGRKIPLEPGKRLRVGRRPPAECVLRDRTLSALHFELLWDGKSCELRDLDSANGTEVGGRRVKAASLKDGEAIRAGDSVFVLRVEAGSAGTAGSAAEVIRALSKSQPLYAVLDAARTPRVLELLSSAEEQFQCLYDGESAVELAACAPYLVRLPERSRLLRKLVRHGWGQSWGVYFVCEAPFAEVRKHLRHFLMVKTEDGKDYFFRFYDPRVLGVFLQTCEEDQEREFFGPVRTFYHDSLTGSAPRA
jgi:hypothetical protein